MQGVLRFLALLAGCTAWFAIGAPRVAAELNTFQFYAVVEDVMRFGPLTKDVELPDVGAVVLGTYTFESTAVDTGSQPYQGVYRTEAPGAFRASIGEFDWQSDDNFIAVIDGSSEADPPQQDIYETGANRMVLDSHPDVFEQLDIWISTLRLEFDAAQWSDDSLPVSPVMLAGWNAASFTLIGDSSGRMDLSPVPLVIIRAKLTAPILGDLDDDDDIDGADFLLWQRELGSPSTRLARAVPEPNTMALSLCVWGFVWGRRRVS